MPRTVAKRMQDKERDPEKIRRVLEAKGYKDGRLPRGKELHHIKPVVLGGKTSKLNVRVVKTAKHKQIHANRKKAGKI